MERIFQGQFRYVYLFVKTASLYAGTFLLCYFWPKFLNLIVDPPPLPPLETMALLPPIGLLVLGACLGARMFLVHLALLMIAAPVAYWASPSAADDSVEALISRWLSVILATYLIGAVFGARQQLRRFKAESDG